MPTWQDEGQKYLNDYYLERYLRDYDARRLSLDEARDRLEKAGIETYGSSREVLGYKFPGGSGLLLSLLPEDIDRVIHEHGKLDYGNSIPQEPIVLQDTYKRIWRWLRGH